MSSTGSITHWLGQLQAGDQEAAQRLWECYFERLVGLARKKLQGVPRRAADEEDVALSAFASFCRGAGRGQFPLLADRENLWRLLVLITARKAFRLVTHELRQKRGSGDVMGESALPGSPDSSSTGEAGIEQIVGTEPTPEFAAQVAEEYERLLKLLNDPQLESVAVWKMEGYTNDEIATKLSCAPRTVERRLRLIRKIWEKEISP